MDPITAAKRSLHSALHEITAGADPSPLYADDARWWGSHPFNENQGIDFIRGFWRGLRHSFPDMERRDSIFVAGESKPDARSDPSLEGRLLVAALCHYQGLFMRDFCGIPASRQVTYLRSCEVHHVDGGKIRHSYVLVDLLDLMRQAGIWPVAPSLGTERMWPSPATCDGVKLHATDPAGGDVSFQTIVSMHNGLLSFDGKSLDTMDHARYWSENFLWYGPAGIGTTRGLGGFEAHHQIPFLKAFPDRTGAGHYVRIGDGDFAVTGGWPSVRATHLGEFMGVAPSGKRIDMRVMDFYRLEKGVIFENWVPIDMIHALLQMGVDVLARVRHLSGDPDTSLG